MPLFGSDPLADELHVLASEFKALRGADQARLDRYARYRKENQEARAADLDSSVGRLTTGDDYGRQATRRDEKTNRHAISVPLGKATTVKHAYRIAGKLPDAVVDPRLETPQERHRSDTMEKIVWAIHRASNGDAEIASAAWDSSELGSACFEVYWDIETMTPRYRSIDPATVFVVKGAHDPHDFQRVYRYWTAPKASVIAEYRDQLFRGQPVQTDKIGSGEKRNEIEYVTIVQVSDKQRCFRFTLQGEVPLYEELHSYGFVNYVVIPNLGPEREVWGWSDYESVRALGRYIALALSREADILRASANGAMKLKGSAKVSPGEAARVLREGGVLPLGRDGDLEPIGAPDVPAFAAEHTARALQLFKMVGFAPDAAWGDGAAMSGSDRSMQLGPMLEYTAMKQVNWGSGLKRLFQMCFKMTEDKMPAGSTARYSGMKPKGARRDPFSFLFGPGADPVQQQTPSLPDAGTDGALLADDGSGGLIELPMNPKDLFDGEYEVRFVWNNRVDPDDPAFVASELNKFAQGAQSLRTTLERLGIQAPEDEMKLIEDEADRFPWLRNGMIALIEAQLRGNGQGQGGGAPFDPTAAISDAASAMASSTTASTQADQATGALNGSVGAPYGAA